MEAVQQAKVDSQLILFAENRPAAEIAETLRSLVAPAGPTRPAGKGGARRAPGAAAGGRYPFDDVHGV